MKLNKKFWSTFLEHIIVIEIYTLLTIIVFHKIFVLGFDKYIIGDYGDGWHFIWNFWWVKEKVILEGNLSRLFYTDYLFYPHGATLVFHTLSPLNCFIAFPLTYIFNLRATYNILVLSSFILTGYFSYILAKTFIEDKFPCFLTGLFITLSPFHISKALGYFNLLKIEWIILFLYFYFKFILKKRNRYLLLSGITLGIVGLSEFHYLYFSFIFIGISCIYFFLFDLFKSKKFKKGLDFSFKNLIVAGIACLITFPWLLKMYFGYITSPFPKKYGKFITLTIKLGFR
jgi:hypothetical protein